FTTTNFDPSSFGNYTFTPTPYVDSTQPLTRRAMMAENGLSINTGPVWIIAMMPVIMLVLPVLFLLAGAAARDSPLCAGVAGGGSSLAAVVRAVIGRTRLSRMGHARTANWEWALLGARVCLIARMANVVREAGRGLRPFRAGSALTIVLIGAAVAVPG